jgi:DNA polymerase-1
MLKAKWTHVTIKTNRQAQEMVDQYNRDNESGVLAGAFDSETTGLHIIFDNPFLFQFGWVTDDLRGYTYVVDIERQPKLARQVIKAWNKLALKLAVYLAHNVKYDLNMLINFGEPYIGDNLSDSMFYIRYSHDALRPDQGGPPMGLKPYSQMYIDGQARHHEKTLDEEKTAIAKSFNMMLIRRLKACGTPPPQYGFKSYTMKFLENIFKDPVFIIEQLPQNVQDTYYEWLNNDIPLWLQSRITEGIVKSDDIRYDKLNRENIIRYGHWDIVWVLEIFLKLDPTLHARGNEKGVEVENQLIRPLLEMERVGFKANKPYLIEARDKLKPYISLRRQRMFELAGQEFKTGQHELIRGIINDRFGFELESTKREILEQLQADIKQGIQNSTTGANDECIEFISVLNEVRTLEKWYAAYIMRFLRDMQINNTDRLYTQIHQVGTVSGRVTSDFQQFHKDPINTVDGIELFHPRKIILVDGGDFDSIVYLDYSQIELRFQALYTILVQHPDMNLCRAYMPYECHTSTELYFDPTNINHIKNFKEFHWYLNESPNTEWVKTDVHGATTKLAFEIDESHPDYHSLRYKGKRLNFAKNYGASLPRVPAMFPEYSLEKCKVINDAYYKAFPGVKEYHNYCYARAYYAFTENLFGIKYYNVSGHKLINILVQGSAAFYLKLKIIELYNFSKEQNIKTKWQMQIHDELSWQHHKDDDPQIFFEFKRIMEDWPDTLVPVVAEMEVTQTNWAEKKEVKSLADLQVCTCT